jgi:hypothetical protein
MTLENDNLDHEDHDENNDTNNNVYNNNNRNHSNLASENSVDLKNIDHFKNIIETFNRLKPIPFNKSVTIKKGIDDYIKKNKF